MKKSITRLDPAFPITNELEVTFCYERDMNPRGMSKRFYAACAAMQGILSSGKFILPNEKDFAYCSELSYRFADELLKQEKL